MAAVARQERLGLPINTDRLRRSIEHWEILELHYIGRDDEFGMYEGTSFREYRLSDLIEANNGTGRAIPPAACN